jgi:hypothetical protein
MSVAQPTSSPPTRQSPCAVVFVERVRCPGCGEASRVPRLRVTKTRENGDGSQTQYRRCLDCGKKFLVVHT